VSANIVVAELDRQISQLVRAAGLTVVSTLVPSDLSTVDRLVRAADVLVIDVRGQSVLPSPIAALRRRFPTMGVVIVASELNPALMLEAMRAGVSEFVTEPLSADDLRTAIDRVAGQQALSSAEQGRVFAFLGAKGGVGTTTLAVNVATALSTADPKGPVLMVDLHATAHGDAGLLLGVESKFSIVDALENTNRLDAAYLKSLVVRTKGGLDVLASPERPSLRTPDGQQVRAFVERVAMYYRFVVLDVPRTDFGILDSLDPLSVVTLVVNQELPTVRRAAQVASILRQRFGKDRVDAVVTRYDARADIAKEDIERLVGLPVWAVMPSDYRKVIAAANAGRPLVSDNHSRLAASVQEFAARLVGEPAPGDAGATKPAGKTGGRLGGFF
jgi:pilus assembly protein CpaE